MIVATVEQPAIATVPEAVYQDTYDEEEAEAMIQFDVKAWAPPELTQTFDSLRFAPPEATNLAL